MLFSVCFCFPPYSAAVSHPGILLLLQLQLLSVFSAASTPTATADTTTTTTYTTTCTHTERLMTHVGKTHLCKKQKQKQKTQHQQHNLADCNNTCRVYFDLYNLGENRQRLDRFSQRLAFIINISLIFDHEDTT